MKFEVIIDKRALSDIKQAAEYYDTQSEGLGQRFKNVLDEHISIIGVNPFFSVRYNDIRCIPVKKFPFMIHFSVDERDKIIKVHAVFHTSRNPDIWGKKQQC